MGAGLILKVKKIRYSSRENQQNAAKELIHELSGRLVQHTSRGRPYIEDGKDISISHSNDTVFGGIVDSGFWLGVDVEHLETAIQERTFLEGILNRSEKKVVEELCIARGISRQKGLILLWSIKEAFAKCLDLDLIPKKIRIEKIEGNGTVYFEKALVKKYRIVKSRFLIFEKFCYTYVLAYKGSFPPLRG